jgi:quinohemoprotein ethanol dehydrogenase
MGSRPGSSRTVTLAALREGLLVHFSLALTVMGAWVGLSAACGAATGPEAQYVDTASGTDWPGFGRTYGEQHFSPLTQIDSRNVGRLGLAWYIDLPPGNAATEPVETGGVLYYAQGLSVIHAVDAASGKELWRYDPHAGEQAGLGLRFSWGGHGLCSWNGKVYVGTPDGRLIALDGKTGQLVWSVQDAIKGGGQFINAAPRALSGKIIVGQGGGDFSFARGYTTAYDAETGKLLWRFYTVPGDPAKGFENKAMAMAAKTWTGQWWKWGGGGEPWNAFAYDAANNQLLFGVGNGYPWNREIRSPAGDNLFLCSIVAVDADTGEYRWHYQFNAGDSWDYDATMDIELADLNIGGKLREVAMEAPKNGYFYVFDRTDGRLLSVGQIATKLTWAKGIDMSTGRPIEVPGIRYQHGTAFEMWPSPRGAHSWMPMAFSPQTGLVYIPRLSQGLTFDSRGIDAGNLRVVGANIGAAKPDSLDETSALIAWNPVTQKLVWEAATFGGWNGGVLATGGDLVFQGQINGRFSAYEASHGKELWHFSAQDALLAAPISYMVGGKQYVSVVVGMTGTAAIDPRALGGLVFDYRTQKRRVLTFALDSNAQLPPAPLSVIQSAPDPDYKPDAALAAQGAAAFGFNCGICHGPEAVSGGTAPDLRSSDSLSAPDIFHAVVHDGTRVAEGMPSFKDLSESEIAGIRQYIRSRAADLRADKTKPPTGEAPGG